MRVLTELLRRLQRLLGEVVGRQILQVLVARPLCHRHELLRVVRRVLRVYHWNRKQAP